MKTIDSSMELVVYVVIVIYSIILHELGHGYVAKLCGDDTAQRAGRITLNPIPHIDWVGSIILPVTAVLGGFGVLGWAKGVPIDPRNLDTRLKEFLVSSAGIITNVLIACLFIGLLKLQTGDLAYGQVFLKVIIVNLGLALFNLLPIPPFDGLQILRSIFPQLKHKYQYIEHHPIAMIVTVIIAVQIFSWFYVDLLRFILNQVF